NALNAAGALAVSDALEIDPDVAAAAISDAPPLAGRFEVIQTPGACDVVVDFAHNPDGIRRSTEAARAVLRGRRGGALWVVASAPGGGGGAGRRGRRAGKAGDHLILTTQRLRPTEPPGRVAPGLLEGARAATGATLTVECERRDAIAAAVAGAGPGDIVLLLG